VLRAASAEVLSPAEVNRLSEHVGDVGGDEWTGKQLRFLASQLTALEDAVPRSAAQSGPQFARRPLWSGAALSVIATEGGHNDRKELLDRLVVQLAQNALQDAGSFAGLLVVAGADHLGAAVLERLSGHARQAGVRLMLMIDQPQGDAEKLVGTGGAVCVMKMYNHRDANVAADFIGRGHKFVVSQLTTQVGKTLTEGGGDNFSAASVQGGNAKAGLLRETGRRTGVTESRGHTWTGVRNWTAADNVGSGTAASRVYEFTVDPQQVLGLPETAFFLVDNTGPTRRVVFADANPGICLLDRVATVPAAG
jgi:hypothetical protein